MLTACFFCKAAEYPDNINLVESGLFFRFDATNILRKNLASVITSISKDHLDWLPNSKQTIEKIVFEKTSSLLESNIVVAKQNDEQTMNLIKKTIKKNRSNKIYYDEEYYFKRNEDNSFYFKDEKGGLELPKPNVLGQFQLENISTAIATLRLLNLDIKDDHIKNGIQKINNLGRLQLIKSGKIKNLVKNNSIFISGDHNEDGARVLNEYLSSLNCNKHLIIGMMVNKDHEKYISYFKDISSITTVDIPNQPNSISGKKLKDKFKNFSNVNYKESIEGAIKSKKLKHGDLLLITGSLYLCGEVLNLN